jgi:HSP20 family protein
MRSQKAIVLDFSDLHIVSSVFVETFRINPTYQEERKFVMETKQALEKEPKTVSSSPVFVEAEKLFDQMKDFSQTVAKRAYQFFEERGREIGHDLEDWFRAEFELTRPVSVELKENNDQIIVRAEVPGFSAENIKICVEPNQLIMSGKSEQTVKETEKKVFSEFRSNQFYRRVGLPVEVDPVKTTATLKDGILQLTLVKSEMSKAVNVEIKSA